MAEQTIVNKKADSFEKYLKDNNLNFFTRFDKGDENQTVLFRSNIQVEGQQLPVNVITDRTNYTIIRVFVRQHNIKENNRADFESFMNQMNRSYKVFKYAATDDGDLFLDACMPSTQESFDPKVVRIVLDVVVDHLNHEYKKVMQLAWR